MPSGPPPGGMREGRVQSATASLTRDTAGGLGAGDEEDVFRSTSANGSTRLPGLGPGSPGAAGSSVGGSKGSGAKHKGRLAPTQSQL